MLFSALADKNNIITGVKTAELRIFSGFLIIFLHGLFRIDAVVNIGNHISGIALQFRINLYLRIDIRLILIIRRLIYRR